MNTQNDWGVLFPLLLIIGMVLMLAVGIIGAAFIIKLCESNNDQKKEV